jgi:SIR2-like domain/TIR domain
MGADSDNSKQGHEDAVPRQLRVFINYRNDDAWAEALLLYDRLAARLGSESVFLDTRNLKPGMNWFEEIKSQRDSCRVLLALIGAHWIPILKARDHEAIVKPAEDYVRFEIQHALRPNSGIVVIPVLLGDDVPFSAELLPKSLQALAKIEVAQVRQKLFNEDVAHLIARLEAIAREQPDPPPEPVPLPLPGQRQQADGTGLAAPRPNAAHCELVLQQMVDEGHLVVFLGSRLTAGHSDPPRGPGLLPDAHEIAAGLAHQFGVKPPLLDLPEIAQYVSVTRGEPDLYRTLRQLLTVDCEPGPVHQFLARFPGKLEELGLEKRYQLIVSTNFDRALERAFEDGPEPYDLAVYMASGRDQGKFVYFPHDGAPEPIVDPNSYTKLPIGEDYELERTLIVKIHGAVDGAAGGYRWKESCVITEDNYIDYLSKSPIESLVPTQILGRLRESHCLFLGYPVRDWNLRVFLKRIWEGKIGARSWAVGPDPNALEKDFWAQSNVDLYAADLGDYVNLLQERLIARTHERRDVSAET